MSKGLIPFLLLAFVLCCLVIPGSARSDWEYLYSEVGDGNGLIDISMPDERAACTLGVHKPGGSTGASEALVMCTDDGGQNWWPYRLSGGLVIPTAVHMPSPSVALMTSSELVGISLVSKLHRSDDGGRSWAVYDLPAGTGVLSDIFFVDEQRGWLAGGESILRSVDGGQSWQAAQLPALGSGRSVEGLHFVDELNGWAVGGVPAQEPEDEWGDSVSACCGFILGTADGGQTWSLAGDGFAGQLRRIWFSDNLNGWAVGGGEAGLILHSTDGGASWNPQNLPDSGYGTADYVSDVVFPQNTQTGYALGNIGEGNPMVLLTGDGGETWQVDQSYSSAFDGLTGFDAFARYSRLVSLSFPLVGRGMVCGENAVLLALADAGFCADADGDGHRAASCGGDDCDDANSYVSPSAEELCNSLDDNCNGIADDGIDFARDPRHCGSCGFNCQPAQVCWDGVCTLDCPEQLLRCGQMCADVQSDLDHCGACDQECSLSNGRGACSDGSCVMDSCVEGFWDLDGSLDNGCEYVCSDTGSEICDGVDNDCNGLVDDGLNDCAPDGGSPDGGSAAVDGDDDEEPSNSNNSGGCSHGPQGGLWFLALLALALRPRRNINGGIHQFRRF